MDHSRLLNCSKPRDFLLNKSKIILSGDLEQQLKEMTKHRDHFMHIYTDAYKSYTDLKQELKEEKRIRRIAEDNCQLTSVERDQLLQELKTIKTEKFLLEKKFDKQTNELRDTLSELLMRRKVVEEQNEDLKSFRDIWDAVQNDLQDSERKRVEAEATIEMLRKELNNIQVQQRAKKFPAKTNKKIEDFFHPDGDVDQRKEAKEKTIKVVPESPAIQKAKKGRKAKIAGAAKILKATTELENSDDDFEGTMYKKPRNKTGKKDDDQDWKPNSGSEAEIPDVKGEDVELFKPNKNLQNTSRFLARLEQPIPFTEEEIQEFGRQLNKHLENTKNPGHFTVGDHTWETPASRFANTKNPVILENCVALLKKTNFETISALLKKLHITTERKCIQNTLNRLEQLEKIHTDRFCTTYTYGPRPEDKTDPKMSQSDVDQLNTQAQERAARPEEDYEFDSMDRKIHVASLLDISQRRLSNQSKPCHYPINNLELKSQRLQRCGYSNARQHIQRDAPPLVDMPSIVYDALATLPGSHGSVHQIVWLARQSWFVVTPDARSEDSFENLVTVTLVYLANANMIKFNHGYWFWMDFQPSFSGTKFCKQRSCYTCFEISPFTNSKITLPSGEKKRFDFAADCETGQSVYKIETKEEDGAVSIYIGATDSVTKIRHRMNHHRCTKFRGTEFTFSVLEKDGHETDWQLSNAEWNWQNQMLSRWPFGHNDELSFLMVDFPRAPQQIDTIVGKEELLQGKVVLVKDVNLLLQQISSSIQVLGQSININHPVKYDANDLRTLATGFRRAVQSFRQEVRVPIVINGIAKMISEDFSSDCQQISKGFGQAQGKMRTPVTEWMRVSTKANNFGA